MNRNILMPIMISMTRFYHKKRLFCRFSSVLYHNTIIFFTAALFILLVSITSCEEKPTLVGIKLLPETDFVSFKSDTTIKVEGYTRYTDSAVTNNRTYSYLGKLHDPYFGDTKADFVGQFRILKKWPGGGPFWVDSVKLNFAFQGAKGKLDTNIFHNIKLYEITEELSSVVKYYSNRDPRAGLFIGSFVLPSVSKDTVKGISLTLPVWFGTHLMRDTTKLTQEDIANDFRSFFKGIYFTLEDSPNSLLGAITFTASDFFIRVYYSNPKASNMTYDFVINSNSVRYNRFTRVFSAADPSKKINHINDGIKDTVVYLQAFGGVFPQIKIPQLKTIKDSITRLSVSKAKLTFSVLLDSVNYSATTVPAQIMMKYTKSDTVQYIVPDYSVNASFFDGTFNSTSKTYSFNLASFVQEYFKGNIPEPVVEMYFPEGEFKNVILKVNNTHSPVKFQFTYTRF
jgi:hypothetical protein